MLTRELINKPLSEYTDQEYKSAMKDMREMKACCPKKGMIKLIKHQADQFNLRGFQMFEKMIDLTFCYLTRRPFKEGDQVYSYTLQWFSYFLEKLIVERKNTDVLGEIMTEFSFFDKSFQGQCMTPPDLSTMIVELLNANREWKEENLISDFCCGTGSMLLPKLGIPKEDHLIIIINDKDKDMTKACFIQLWLNAQFAFLEKRFKQITILGYVSDALTEYSQGGCKRLVGASISDNGIQIDNFKH